jgi:hypothetical protein
MPRREVAAEIVVLIAYALVGVMSRGVEQLRSRLRRA